MSTVNVNYNLLANNQSKLPDIKKSTLDFLKFHKVISGETADFPVKEQYGLISAKRVKLQKDEEAVPTLRGMFTVGATLAVILTGIAVASFMNSIPALGIVASTFGGAFLLFGLIGGLELLYSDLDNRRNEVDQNEIHLMQIANAMGKIQVLNKKYTEFLFDKAKTAYNYQEFVDAKKAMDQLEEFQGIFKK